MDESRGEEEGGRGGKGGGEEGVRGGGREERRGEEGRGGERRGEEGAQSCSKQISKDPPHAVVILTEKEDMSCLGADCHPLQDLQTQLREVSMAPLVKLAVHPSAVSSASDTHDHARW